MGKKQTYLQARKNNKNCVKTKKWATNMKGGNPTPQIPNATVAPAPGVGNGTVYSGVGMVGKPNLGLGLPPPPPPPPPPQIGNNALEVEFSLPPPPQENNAGNNAVNNPELPSQSPQSSGVQTSAPIFDEHSTPFGFRTTHATAMRAPQGRITNTERGFQGPFGFNQPLTSNELKEMTVNDILKDYKLDDIPLISRHFTHRLYNVKNYTNSKKNQNNMRDFLGKHPAEKSPTATVRRSNGVFNLKTPSGPQGPQESSTNEEEEPSTESEQAIPEQHTNSTATNVANPNTSGAVNNKTKQTQKKPGLFTRALGQVRSWKEDFSNPEIRAAKKALNETKKVGQKKYEDNARQLKLAQNKVALLSSYANANAATEQARLAAEKTIYDTKYYSKKMKEYERAEQLRNKLKAKTAKLFKNQPESKITEIKNVWEGKARNLATKKAATQANILSNEDKAQARINQLRNERAAAQAAKKAAQAVTKAETKDSKKQSALVALLKKEATKSGELYSAQSNALQKGMHQARQQNKAVVAPLNQVAIFNQVPILSKPNRLDVIPPLDFGVVPHQNSGVINFGFDDINGGLSPSEHQQGRQPQFPIESENEEFFKGKQTIRTVPNRLPLICPENIRNKPEECAAWILKNQQETQKLKHFKFLENNDNNPLPASQPTIHTFPNRLPLICPPNIINNPEECAAWILEKQQEMPANLPRAPSVAANLSASALAPPPPPPPMPNFAALAPAAGAPPPPPAPPMPPAANASTAAGAPPGAPDGRRDLLAQIQKGQLLKKTNVSKAPHAVAPNPSSIAAQAAFAKKPAPPVAPKPKPAPPQ